MKIAEDGSGQGGYAKEMSQEFKQAQEELFRTVIKDIDIVITTALIPGRPAPKLITKQMVDSMREASRPAGNPFLRHGLAHTGLHMAGLRRCGPRL